MFLSRVCNCRGAVSCSRRRRRFRSSRNSAWMSGGSEAKTSSSTSGGTSGAVEGPSTASSGPSSGRSSTGIGSGRAGGSSSAPGAVEKKPVMGLVPLGRSSKLETARPRTTMRQPEPTDLAHLARRRAPAVSRARAEPPQPRSIFSVRVACLSAPMETVRLVGARARLARSSSTRFQSSAAKLESHGAQASRESSGVRWNVLELAKDW
mmetsp:Transcript_13178/g.41720  ORF Transcript_13178/g.41720 Transcript_13178/m.41720 type:complete len:208 (-) Transcript_13178:964-1587(-)